MDETATEQNAPPVDLHRRRAAYLYGLIVSGAVLAASPDALNIAHVALALLGTLVIYWAAETYVHFISSRTHLQRRLTRHERVGIVRDGWPLVTACGVPLLFLAVEALLGIETGLAVKLTLVVNTVLLLIVGWEMGRASGLRGRALVLSVGATGLLGVAMIALKTALH